MSSIICSDIDELTISLKAVKSVLAPSLLSNDIVALYYGFECDLDHIDWFGIPPKLIDPRIKKGVNVKVPINIKQFF